MFIKIRDHYLEALPGRERIAYVGQLFAIGFAIFCTAAMLLAFLITRVYGTSFFLAFGGAHLGICAASFCYAAENWYYEPKNSAWRIVIGAAELFLALLAFGAVITMLLQG